MDGCAAKQRTKTGCWTCKRRRKKCDEGRPHCEACLAVGVLCEGYAKQLVWDNGIASRGKFAGAAVPSPEHAARKPRGRARDKKNIPALDHRNSAPSPESIFAQAQHADANDVQYSMKVTPQPASPFDVLFPGDVEEFESLRTGGENLNLEDQLMRDFFTTGHLTLYSTSSDDSPIVRNVLPLCHSSPTVRSACIAYQALISHLPLEQFQAFYNTALQQFRKDVADPVAVCDDSTLATSILLCSIGSSQNLPWTFHIQPMEKLLVLRGASSLTAFGSHALDILGYFDLPTFVLNRQHPRLNIWRRYCFSGHSPEGLIDDVEPVSGLPRSLLDIFSLLEEPGGDERLWCWPGCLGSLLQCHLWDAYRHAGILKYRELQKVYYHSGGDNTASQGALCTDTYTISSQPHSPTQTQRPTLGRDAKLPSDIIVLNRLVACLSALAMSAGMEGNQIPVMNAIMYPLFVGASQIALLDSKPEWTSLMAGMLDNKAQDGCRQAEFLAEILSEMKDSSMSAEEVAARRGFEIALF
ncbi:hypothetical protein DL95DRAFT_337383 [Leptodontidium sp. 2 PMI_412]|nr:hypothetical protein DL95DRAFT_337383 [Leptodontidium sp. 2 PMI_412]